MHEKAPNHMKSYPMWVETASRLQAAETIDKAEKLLTEKESERWRNVLATFDPVMQDHISRVLKEKSGIHYCGKNIVNELIQLLGNNIPAKIVSAIQKSTYYVVIADCTPDVSHVEQLSLTLRYAYMNNENGKVEICERFLGFTSINDSTGSGLTDVIIESVQKNELELKFCHGQGYDNGANMKGKHQGVQKRILDINPSAFFIPCGCHSHCTLYLLLQHTVGKFRLTI